MSALATIDERDLVVIPAPTRVRPVGLTQTRPWDRIAFRAPSAATISPPPPDDDESAPALVWPRAVPVPLPDPQRWCGALVRTCVEVLLGTRAPAQLARWLTTDLYSSLTQRAIGGQHLPSDARRVRIMRVHLCEVDESHYEASVVLHDGRRVRAAAVRIENYRGRWRATVLDIG